MKWYGPTRQNLTMKSCHGQLGSLVSLMSAIFYWLLYVQLTFSYIMPNMDLSVKAEKPKSEMIWLLQLIHSESKQNLSIHLIKGREFFLGKKEEWLPMPNTLRLYIGSIYRFFFSQRMLILTFEVYVVIESCFLNPDHFCTY